MNEELLGRALKGQREKVVIATKFGFNIIKGNIHGVNSQPEHIRQSVNNSLKRLGTDFIDLLYQHRVDPNVPIEEVVGAMAELVREGKVRYLGLSEAGEETLRRAHNIHPISALQSEYSLWERNLEPGIIPLLHKLGIRSCAFCPLGRGFLTGTAKKSEDYSEKDFRRGDPRMQGSNYEQNMKIVSVVTMVAQRNKATPAQVALAWLLQKGDDIVPIPGTKRRNYLEENLQAAKLALSKKDIEELDKALPLVAGARYNAQNMSYIDR